MDGRFYCHNGNEGELTFYEMIHGSNFIMDNDIYSPRCYIERYRRIKCNENCVTHVKTSYKRFILLKWLKGIISILIGNI
jgi:intergrase/recombinase